jgi:hypothetical protein
VWRLHGLGLSYRDIAERVGLSLGGVPKALKRRPAGHSELPADDAVTMERLERLCAAAAPAAAGDLKAIETSRRLLGQLGQLRGRKDMAQQDMPPNRHRLGANKVLLGVRHGECGTLHRIDRCRVCEATVYTRPLGKRCRSKALDGR